MSAITINGRTWRYVPGIGTIIAPSDADALAELRRRQAEARPVVPAYSPWGMRA